MNSLLDVETRSSLPFPDPIGTPGVVIYSAKYNAKGQLIEKYINPDYPFPSGAIPQQIRGTK